jgi:hypothetical protein
VLPMGFVIVLSVFLIASVATIVNSIDLTILTIYGLHAPLHQRDPAAGDPAVPPDQIAIIRKIPRTDRVMEASSLLHEHQDGDGPAAVRGAGRDAREPRLPAPGGRHGPRRGAHAAEGHARGGAVGAAGAEQKGAGGDDRRADRRGRHQRLAGAVRLVGILRGPTWIAFTSKSFCDATFITTPRTTVFTTREPGEKALFALNQT